MSRRSHAYLLLAILAWATGLVAVKAVLGELNAIDITLLRLPIVGSIAMAVMPFLRGDRPTMRSLPIVVLLALLGGVAATLAPAIGLQWVPASAVSIAIAANPLVTVVVSWLVLGEAITPRKLTGLCLALIGLVIVIGVPVAGADAGLYALGISIVILGQMGFGLYFVLARVQLRSIQPAVLITYVSVVTAALSLPFTATMVSVDLRTISLAALGVVVFVSLTHYFGQLGWLLALRRVETSTASLYFLLIPLVTSSLAVAFLSEVVTVGLVVGGCTVLAGLAIALGPWREARI